MKQKLSILLLLPLLMFGMIACQQKDSRQMSKENPLALQGKARQTTLKEVEHHYYYQQLSHYQKENYLILRQKARHYHDTIHLAPDSHQGLLKTLDAFIMDNPDLYWLTGSSYQLEENKDEAFISFKVPKEAKANYQTLQQLGDQIVALAPQQDDYQKVAYFYNYIIDHTEYNSKALEQEQAGNPALVAANQDIKSVLMDHLSVCNGYAQTFQFLCQKAGLDAIYVRGRVQSSRNKQDINHAWNLVKINHTYYAVDTTWGDPTFSQTVSGQAKLQVPNRGQFLCLPDKLMEQTHQANLKLAIKPNQTKKDGKEDGDVWTLPKCPDDSLLFAKQHHFYLEHFDQSQALTLLKQQLAKGEATPSIQVANPDDYHRLERSLTRNATSYHELFQAYWPNYHGFTYLSSPETNSMTFFNHWWPCRKTKAVTKTR